VPAPAPAGEFNAAEVDSGLDDAPVDVGRRTLFKYAGAVAASIPFGASIYGFTSERLNYTVQRVELPIHNLPAPLDGLRIVQLSDIHIGDFMPREELRRAVAMANELEADVEDKDVSVCFNAEHVASHFFYAAQRNDANNI